MEIVWGRRRIVKDIQEVNRAISYVLRIIDIGSVYYITATIFAVIIWGSLRTQKITKRVALTVLLPYLFLVIISTIITRRIKDENHLTLRPFWKIQAILQGGQAKAWLLKEMILNILMLMPVGILTPLLFEKRKMGKTLILGTGISLLIEIFQLVLHRGLAEIDDIIFNTLGVMVGLGIYCVSIRRRISAE